MPTDDEREWLNRVGKTCHPGDISLMVSALRAAWGQIESVQNLASTYKKYGHHAIVKSYVAEAIEQALAASEGGKGGL